MSTKPKPSEKNMKVKNFCAFTVDGKYLGPFSGQDWMDVRKAVLVKTGVEQVKIYNQSEHKWEEA